jgi:hypothetical protein
MATTRSVIDKPLRISKQKLVQFHYEILINVDLNLIKAQTDSFSFEN